MRTMLVAMVAVMLAAIGWVQPAQAQRLPAGSYGQTCAYVEMRGNTLTATCRRADGGWTRSALRGVNRCIGDIGNNEGVLQCMVRGGSQLRGQVVQHYGPPPGPRPVFRPPPYGSPAWREYCRDLERRAADLRARRDWARSPNERARHDEQLRQVREQRRAAGCR